MTKRYTKVLCKETEGSGQTPITNLCHRLWEGSGLIIEHGSVFVIVCNPE